MVWTYCGLVPLKMGGNTNFGKKLYKSRLQCFIWNCTVFCRITPAINEGPQKIGKNSAKNCTIPGETPVSGVVQFFAEITSKWRHSDSWNSNSAKNCIIPGTKIFLPPLTHLAWKGLWLKNWWTIFMLKPSGGWKMPRSSLTSIRSRHSRGSVSPNSTVSQKSFHFH